MRLFIEHVLVLPITVIDKALYVLCKKLHSAINNDPFYSIYLYFGWINNFSR